MAKAQLHFGWPAWTQGTLPILFCNMCLEMFSFIARPGGFIPPYSDTSEVSDMLETAFSVAVGSGTNSYNILPHTQCGAARALSDGKPPKSIYLALASDAVEAAVSIQGTTDPDALSREIERQFAIKSFVNIHSYPSLQEGLSDGRFTANSFLHDIGQRRLLRVTPETLELDDL